MDDQASTTQEPMQAPATNEPTLSKLTDDYNRMANEATALGLAGYRPIAKFRDRASAERRLEQIASSMRAYQSGQEQADSNSEDTEMANAKKKVAKVAAPKKTAAEGYRPGSPLRIEDLKAALLRNQDSLKSKVLDFLVKHQGEPVKASRLSSLLYDKADNLGPLKMVVDNGLCVIMEERKVPFTIARDRTDKGEAIYTLRKK